MDNKIDIFVQYIIPAVVGSSVLTALVNNFFSFNSVKREASIENITKERDIWRKRLRVICAELSELKKEDYELIRILLSEMTVIINPYGAKSWKKWNDNNMLAWVENDGYIWKDIENIREKINNNEEWISDVEQLVYHISILLKLDWERSKKEIRGNKIKNFIYVYIFLVEGMSLFFSKDLISNIFDHGTTTSYLGLIPLFFILAFPFIMRGMVLSIDMKYSEIIGILILIVIYLPLCNYFLKIFGVSYKSEEIIILIFLYFILLFLVSGEVGVGYGKVTSYFQDIKRMEEKKGRKNRFANWLFSYQSIIVFCLCICSMIFSGSLINVVFQALVILVIYINKK